MKIEAKVFSNNTSSKHLKQKVIKDSPGAAEFIAL